MNTKVYNIQVFVNNNKYLKTIIKDLGLTSISYLQRVKIKTNEE